MLSGDNASGVSDFFVLSVFPAFPIGCTDARETSTSYAPAQAGNGGTFLLLAGTPVFRRKNTNIFSCLQVNILCTHLTAFYCHVFFCIYDDSIFSMKSTFFSSDDPIFRNTTGFSRAKGYIQGHTSSGFVIRFSLIQDFTFSFLDSFQIVFCHRRSNSISYYSLVQLFRTGHIFFHIFNGFHITHITRYSLFQVLSRFQFIESSKSSVFHFACTAQRGSYRVYSIY